MRQSTAFLTLLLLLAVAARAEYSAVLSLQPAVDGACVAVEISTPNGAGLAGLRWFHNDADVAFPRLVLLEGLPGVPPALDDPGLILLEVAGASLAWGEVDFGGPVTSSTGTAYAVFFFPAGVATHALGDGGGPGIGLRASEGDAAPFFLTSDGQNWVQFDSAFELGVEPNFAAGKMAPRVLADLREEIVAAGPEENTTYTTQLHPPHPNPFNPRLELSFSLAQEQHVSLEVYDVRGRKVTTLLSEVQPRGAHQILWEGRDAAGQAVASGVYFARMSAGDFVALRRITLLR